MKKILINAKHPEENRIALINNNQLSDLNIESQSHIQKKGNIYKAHITRIEPSLEAAFIDFGAERHGFLPFRDIAPYLLPENKNSGSTAFKVQDHLTEGQELLVQVEKEERGGKGAALTTLLALVGRYLILMPNNPRVNGISKRASHKEREALQTVLQSLSFPEGMGVIIRTASINHAFEDLQDDLNLLLQLWKSIQEMSQSVPAPCLVLEESNIVIRTLRDYLRSDVTQVIIDDMETYEETLKFIRYAMPNYEENIQFYDDPIPLFARYQVEQQIETAYQREVKLPSGGHIVIDRTEAMITIDINSAQATDGVGIEETALQTNLEAADEIARQLRLRDLGGLFAIDFIDMVKKPNRAAVENRMQQALKNDRAQVQIGSISHFGVMEMSRQRLSSPLDTGAIISCPRCHGQGFIRGFQSITLSILRQLQEGVQNERSIAIHALVPVDVATYLLNEKRSDINAIEMRNNLRLWIIPQDNMQVPNYEIKYIKSTEQEKIKDNESYTLYTQENESHLPPEWIPKTSETPEAALVEQQALMDQQKKQHPTKKKTEKKQSPKPFWRRVLTFLAGRPHYQPSPSPAPRRRKKMTTKEPLPQKSSAPRSRKKIHARNTDSARKEKPTIRPLRESISLNDLPAKKKPSEKIAVHKKTDSVSDHDHPIH